MDEILTHYADQAFETACLRRNGVYTTHDLVFSEMLGQLEAAGDAMRYLNSNGQIGWKATSQLRNYLTDLRVDAEADLEEF